MEDFSKIIVDYYNNKAGNDQKLAEERTCSKFKISKEVLHMYIHDHIVEQSKGVTDKFLTDRSVGWPQRHPIFEYLNSQYVECSVPKIFRWEPRTVDEIVQATGLNETLVRETLCDMSKLGSIKQIGYESDVYSCYNYYDGGDTFRKY